MQSTLFPMQLFEPVPSHLIAEFLMIIFMYLFQLGRYFWFLKAKFNNLTFDVFLKGESNSIVRTVTCKVKGRTIKYEGGQKQGKPGEFSGEFIMNPINLKIGEGIHLHKSYDGFNFPKIIIKDNDTFFIQTYYLSNRNRNPKWEYDIFYEAYIWRRQKRK